jgi:hypothetical protein
MSFHLEGPWLSTTGKKRGPKKWASAEAKRAAEKKQADWGIMLKKFDEMKPKFSTGPYNAPKKTIADVMPKTPPGRETPHIASRDTGWVTCAKPADKEYTGNKVVGISTLHKSNGVPVFSQEEAVEISKMRR